MQVNCSEYTSEEMMTIAAARTFRDGATCFVGVGLPSVAACLARELYAPNITLVYESGAIGAKPTAAPLSIADPELAETADFLVSVPEVFSYWLQGGRIEMGFLGAAQVDRYGNINSTVIGDYKTPKLRLPGAGGAPLIAMHAREVVVIVRQTAKSFVSNVDFLSTAPAGPTTVVTDLGIMERDFTTRELIFTAIHPGVDADQIRQATGWPIAIKSDLRESLPPTDAELRLLRELNAR